MKYTICVSGCDDSTKFEMDLTPSQAKVIKVLADKSSESSTYPCEPTVRIEKTDKKERTNE